MKYFLLLTVAYLICLPSFASAGKDQSLSRNTPFASLAIVIILFVEFCLVSIPGNAKANSQAVVMSKCPLGSPEAEEIYQEARRYRYGVEGRRRDPDKALELFEKAMFMGNSKAPLGIGGLYQWEYADVYKDKGRFKFMLKMYNTGIQMGCAEGHVLLAECYFDGWGVPVNERKALEELQQAVEKGSPRGMELYGQYLLKITKQTEKSRVLFRQALALGHGDAAYHLAISYLGRDNDRMYTALRYGARLGSIICLRRLAFFYREGSYGVQENKELADCVTKIKDSINWFYSPKPVENFDALCPHPTPLNVTP